MNRSVRRHDDNGFQRTAREWGTDDDPPTVAVACQGGRSHTAFTAGVLWRFLDGTEGYEFGAYRHLRRRARGVVRAPDGRRVDGGPDGVRGGADARRDPAGSYQPPAQRGDPSTLGEIADRRNELAGNLSLAQELHSINRMNDRIDDGPLPPDRYKPVTVRQPELDETRLDGESDLGPASKLDRRSGVIEALMAPGEAQAGDVLADADAHHLLGPA